MTVAARVKETLIIIFIIAVAIPLRFINLGYSDFQDDEKKASYAYQANKADGKLDFFLMQRKGPMQFFISHIPYSITGDVRNEVAQRLPFAIINILSIVVLYLLLLKITKSSLAALFGSLLYLTNGFVVGFSRIAQYQSLNLFFSFLSLYMFCDLVEAKDKWLRNSLLGTLFFSFSLLAHWDAIYYLVPTIFFVVKFLLRKDVDLQFKKKLVGYNLLLGSVIILPFLIPYLLTQLNIQSNLNYLQKRVGISTYDFARHRFIFELYNPYITLPLFLSLIFFSLFFIKKNYLYFLWFIVNLSLIRLFMVKPGTHIYNYVIPVIFLISVTAGAAFSKLSKWTLPVAFITVFAASSALYYQSYFLFVDHSKEYPWESKFLYQNYTTPYVLNEVLTFGFPHFRNWRGLNDFINSHHDGCTYITNEGKEISQIYIDAKFGKLDKCYYVVVITRPFISSRDGVAYGEAAGKPILYRYDARGETYMRVYRINNKPKAPKSTNSLL